MANLRADNLTGTGGRNAITGSVFFSNAESDYLSVGSAGDFNFLHNGASDFAAEFWVRPAFGNDRQSVFSTGGNSSSTGFTCRIMEDGATGGSNGYKVLVQYSRGVSGNYLCFLGGTLDVGSWSHVALEFTTSNKQLAIYVNGVLTNSSDLDGTANGTFGSGNFASGNSTYPLEIGREPYGTTLYLDGGFVSNLRIVKGTAVYTSAFTPPTEKLTAVAGTVLLCCQDSDDPTQEATGKTITGYGGLDLIRAEKINGRFSGDPASNGWTVHSGASASYANGQWTVTSPNSQAWSGASTSFTSVIGQQYRLTALVVTSNNWGSISVANGGQSAAKIVYAGWSSGGPFPLTVNKIFTATATTTHVSIDNLNTTNATVTTVQYVSVKPVEVGKAPKVLPPVGIDEGVVLDGDIKINSPGVMYFPTGDTSQRGRGRALFGGGSTVINTIQYLNIQSQGNAQDFGDLSAGRYETECASSSTRGVWGGGYIESPNVKVDTIEYVTIATTSNTTDFGNLTVARGHLAGVCNSTRGVFVNGTTNPSPHPVVNTIDYITTATTGNATDFGDTTTASKPMGGGRSSTTRGVFTLGNAPSAVNTMEYVTIASTGNSADFGDAIVSGWGRGAGNISSGTRGILGGGNPALNTIEYITIASLGNGTDFGDLVVGRRSAYSAGSTVRGVFGGGKTPTQLNSIEYITIASTGNAADFGDLINSKSFASGLSDCHGGLS